MKRSISNSLISNLFTSLLLLAACGGVRANIPTRSAPPTKPTPTISLTTAPVEEVGQAIYEVEAFANFVAFPVAMEFAPDGRLFIAEKNGTVRAITPDGKVSDPILTLANIDASGERGLLGLALDPNFAENGYLWAFYTRGDALVNRVSRFTVTDDKAVDEQVSFEFKIAFETSTILNGGGLHFGPDGMLYISAGSTNNVFASNEPDSPQGKLHRVDPATFPAAPAPGNPTPGSTIYARGLRNMFDFTFNPANGWLYGTENGGDCDDEINLIAPGGDYGWHTDGLCEDNALPADYPYQKPLLYFTPTISPTGIMFYDGDVFPEWKGNMIFCSWHVGKMIRVELTEDGYHIKKTERIETGLDRQCRIDLLQGPDGNIYYSDITAIYRVVRAR
jgi:glucose/arabinose dehydrogenase